MATDGALAPPLRSRLHVGRRRSANASHGSCPSRSEVACWPEAGCWTMRWPWVIGIGFQYAAIREMEPVGVREALGRAANSRCAVAYGMANRHVRLDGSGTFRVFCRSPAAKDLMDLLVHDADRHGLGIRTSLPGQRMADPARNQERHVAGTKGPSLSPEASVSSERPHRPASSMPESTPPLKAPCPPLFREKHTRPPAPEETAIACVPVQSCLAS